MGSPRGASKFPDNRATPLISESLTGLFPVRLPLPRPWASSGRSLRVPQSEIAVAPQIGVDLVEIAKVRRVFEGRKELQTEVFTEEELRYSRRQRRPFEHLAARYAAKEAVFKGLGAGLTGAMRWQDVETVRGVTGEPRLILRGEAARLAAAQGFRRCSVSLTHAGEYALAAVLFTG